ncbi:fused transcript cleavage factor/unknown domain fusion protein [Leptospira ellinghausenii]|uniref:Transcription elongation factor GreA n=1 Tax=Leptospira ellinghausenii TaxID=1917822 RepID=A0A2P2DAF7_9LEPT|nr:transcription elongation factor GreA [Leptospira ellinghausenii]GBF41611.1 fused transcript cleavage factor/unknown domain fusion protein [Leptospira ellinghausenii]
MPETITEDKSNKIAENDKLTPLFNEEIYVRADAGTVPVSKFKIFDDVIDAYKAENRLAEAKQKIEDHFKEHPESISAKYMLMIISFMEDSMGDANLVKNILDSFKAHAKWTIIEYITDSILRFGDHRLALRVKAEALDKLKKNKELKVVLEKLAKQDRKNPEIAKKYGFSIMEEDKPKAMSYLKLAVEMYAKNKEYVPMEEIWPTIVQNNYEDVAFFDKIERILLGQREKTRLVGLLYPIVEPFKAMEDWDHVIYFLKKILEHEPASQKARNELIRSYKQKYAAHSLLEDFLKMSELGNNRKPVKLCITNFERNIVFDTGNYVMHRNWGVGKITSISQTGDSIFVDFEEKKDHKLSIQMAITSLKPLKKDHIWVQHYEDKKGITAMFQENLAEFLKQLLTSYENRMLISDMKNELIGTFLKADEWSKWWAKVKTVLKKEANIGMNPKKKDEVVYHEKPITHSETLTQKFQATNDVNKKLEIAMEAVRDSDEAAEAGEFFISHYVEEESARDIIRKISAYLYLEEAGKAWPTEEFSHRIREPELKTLIQTLTKEDALKISKSLENTDIKKGFKDLIRAHHPEAINILIGLLFEVPVKVNRSVFQNLVADEKYAELNLFVETVSNKSKENPEVFLWVAKSILSHTWKFDWLKVSEEDLVLRVFRILKPLAKIEDKGTKLKNQAMDILFGKDNSLLRDILTNADDEYVRKLFALFKEVPYVTDLEKDQLYALINELKPNIVWDEYDSEEDADDDPLANLPHDVVLVTRRAFNAKKLEFEHLVNVEMAENSRDIGEAQEKGDLRENAEYKAAMEKQVQLQAAIKRLEAELKSARILDLSDVKTEKVGIGTTVRLKNKQTGEVVTYSILGAWDADTEKNIISYQSPLAKSLLGKNTGNEATLVFGATETVYEVLDIARYSMTGQEA